MIMKKGWVLGLLFVLIWCGCATPPPEKPLASRYPDWSAETINKVQHGVIELGMTKAQVMEALKHREAREFTREDDTWSYLDKQTLGVQENKTDRVNLLTFKDDRLVDMSTRIRIYHKGW